MRYSSRHLVEAVVGGCGQGHCDALLLMSTTMSAGVAAFSAMRSRGRHAASCQPPGSDYRKTRFACGHSRVRRLFFIFFIFSVIFCFFCHVLPSSFSVSFSFSYIFSIFYHVSSFLFHFRSFSIIFYHFLSFSIMFFHFLAFSLHFLSCFVFVGCFLLTFLMWKIILFVPISGRGRYPFGPSFPFFSTFFLSVFFFFLSFSCFLFFIFLIFSSFLHFLIF